MAVETERTASITATCKLSIQQGGEQQCPRIVGSVLQLNIAIDREDCSTIRILDGAADTDRGIVGADAVAITRALQLSGVLGSTSLQETDLSVPIA